MEIKKNEIKGIAFELITVVIYIGLIFAVTLLIMR